MPRWRRRALHSRRAALAAAALAAALTAAALPTATLATTFASTAITATLAATSAKDPCRTRPSSSGDVCMGILVSWVSPYS